MKIYLNNFLKNASKVNSKIINKYTSRDKKNNYNDDNNDFNIINLDDILELESKCKKNIDSEQKFNNYSNNYTRKGAIYKKTKLLNLNISSKNIIGNLSDSKENTKEENIDKKIKFNKYNLPKSYYVLLIFMVFLAGLSIYMVKKSNNIFTEEDYAVFNNQDNNANIENNMEKDNLENSNLQNVNTSNIDTRNISNENNSSITSSNAINKIQDQVNNIISKKEEPLIFVKPLKGEISKIFSNDKLIYSKTLDMWKTHDGIDVKGDLGDIVYSIERGTVEKIYDDAFYGITLVINHGQGYKSSYSNLSEDTFVKTGDKVKKSQKIGKIGTTSIGEIKDVSHLHFMLYMNENIVDPSSIFK